MAVKAALWTVTVKKRSKSEENDGGGREILRLKVCQTDLSNEYRDGLGRGTCKVGERTGKWSLLGK